MATRPKRFRFRFAFSLRMLLAITFVSAVVMGLWTRYQHIRESIEVIERHGGKVYLASERRMAYVMPGRAMKSWHYASLVFGWDHVDTVDLVRDWPKGVYDERRLWSAILENKSLVCLRVWNGAIQRFDKLDRLENLESLDLDLSSSGQLVEGSGGLESLRRCSQLRSLEIKRRPLRSHYRRSTGRTWAADLSFLGQLPRLQHLTLNHGSDGDVAAIAEATSLETIELELDDRWSSHPIELDPLCKLTNLKTIVLKGQAEERIKALDTMPQLERIELDKVRLVDGSSLANLSELEELIAPGSAIEDASALANMRRLRAIEVATLRGKLETLKDLPLLERLDVFGIRGKSLDFLPPSVTELTMNVQDSASLSGLRDHPNLRELDLEGSVADLEVLATIPTLERVALRGNDVPFDMRLLERMPNLRYLDLRYGVCFRVDAIPEHPTLRTVLLPGLTPMKELRLLRESNPKCKFTIK